MTTRTPVIPDEWIMILLQLLPNDDRINEHNNNGEDSTTAAGMDNDAHRWRLRMSHSIEELRTLYLQQARRDDAELRPPPEWRIEPLMTQLRTDGQYFSTTIIPQERQRIASFRSLIVPTEQQPPAVACLLQMLLSEHQLQLQCEELLLSQVLYPTFDTCYDEDASTRTDVNLQYCRRTLLRRRPIVPDHMDLLLQHINQQQQQQQQEETIGDNHQSRRNDAVVSRSSLQEQLRPYFVPPHPTNDEDEDDDEESNHTTLPTASATEPGGSIDATTMSLTCRTIGDESWSWFHTATNGNWVQILLVIGSVGSGKTCICQQFEELISCSTPSTISGRSDMISKRSRVLDGGVTCCFFNILLLVYSLLAVVVFLCIL